MRDFAARGISRWPRDEARKYYAAGAPAANDYDALYDRLLAYDRTVLDRGARHVHVHRRQRALPDLRRTFMIDSGSGRLRRPDPCRKSYPW
jgi:hypothetical protein